MTAFEAILLTIVTASTPLLISAIGELVAERSGVLNLGLEGMMAMGAACSFAAAVTFDSTIVGVAAGMFGGSSWRRFSRVPCSALPPTRSGPDWR